MLFSSSAPRPAECATSGSLHNGIDDGSARRRYEPGFAVTYTKPATIKAAMMRVLNRIELASGGMRTPRELVPACFPLFRTYRRRSRRIAPFLREAFAGVDGR